MCRINYFAILSIVCVEMFALTQGVNGIALSLSVGCVAGLGGFEVGKIYKKN